MARKRQCFEAFSDLGNWWREFARYHGAGESRTSVAPVAERLVGRLAAPAKRDHGSARQAERSGRGIEDFEVALDAERAIVVAGDFCGWHEERVAGKGKKSKVASHPERPSPSLQRVSW
jgi:hypothetical protein